MKTLKTLLLWLIALTGIFVFSGCHTYHGRSHVAVVYDDNSPCHYRGHYVYHGYYYHDRNHRHRCHYH